MLATCLFRDKSMLPANLAVGALRREWKLFRRLRLPLGGSVSPYALTYVSTGGMPAAELANLWSPVATLP